MTLGMPGLESSSALVPDRPAWTQIVALFGCFLGAVGVGSAVGAVLQPEGEATSAVVIFALLLVFVGGMALWGTIAASIMAKAFFNGDLAKAVLRFFLRGRRREDLPAITLDRAKIIAAAVRAFGWTRVFVWLAAGVALVAAPLAGFFAESGFFLSALLTAMVVIAYGDIVRRLARAGYLVPPDVE